MKETLDEMISMLDEKNKLYRFKKDMSEHVGEQRVQIFEDENILDYMKAGHSPQGAATRLLVDWIDGGL